MSLIVLIALIGFSHFVTYPTLAWALAPPNKHIPGPKIAPLQTFLLQLPNREWESFWVHDRAQAKAKRKKGRIRQREGEWQMCGVTAHSETPSFFSSEHARPAQPAPAACSESHEPAVNPTPLPSPSPEPLPTAEWALEQPTCKLMGDLFPLKYVFSRPQENKLQSGLGKGAGAQIWKE